MTLAAPTTIGIVLLTLVAVAWGGTFLLRVVGGQAPANELQRAYFRAGHAHAGVLVILGLLIQVLVSDTRVPGWGQSVGSLVLWSAILMPAGFFLSVLGQDPARPNALRWLIWLGATFLAAGLVGTGVALLTVG